MREKVKLDPVKVNTMRLSMTDLEIRKELWTSTVNINNQCWTRRKNRIPFIQRNLVTKQWKPTFHKPVIDERNLETRSWSEVYPEKKQNKWEWEIIEIGMRPVGFFKNYIK